MRPQSTTAAEALAPIPESRNEQIPGAKTMTISGNHATEVRVKSLLGPRSVERVRVGTMALLRVVSHLPTQTLRLFGLKCAGAQLGVDIVFAPGVEVLSPWRLRIGSHTNIGRGAHLDSRGDLRIGNNVNISDQVAIWTAEHDIQSPTFVMTRAPVVIEDRVWVCFRSIVMPGVRLGEGAVVAAGAVVTKSVAPFTVVAGVPARPIGKRAEDLTYQLGDLRNSAHRP